MNYKKSLRFLIPLLLLISIPAVVFAAESDDIARETFGMLGGLGSLFVEGFYIIMMLLLGITLGKRGSFSLLIKKFGEEGAIPDQLANAIGIFAYCIFVLITIPLVADVAKRFFS